ncbi:hypothetical protein QVD17_05291 [Tagetes erecta]|uniref:Uncharacterized protein n=1 Tax=Tagetes erecta TaxID=13708 RepID=A0AAD8PAF1_TARER|nr:hypothetical protein QVD17_05291 [Tagetes erecta]
MVIHCTLIQVTHYSNMPSYVLLRFILLLSAHLHHLHNHFTHLKTLDFASSATISINGEEEIQTQMSTYNNHQQVQLNFHYFTRFFK